MLSKIMCSNVTISMAVAFNVRSHIFILNGMHDINMLLLKVLNNIWYWFKDAFLILKQTFVLCLIV